MGQVRKVFGILLSLGFSSGILALDSGCETETPKPVGNVTDVRPFTPVTPAYQPPMYDNSSSIPTVAQPVSADPFANAASTSSSPIVSTTPIGKTAKITAADVAANSLTSVGSNHTVKRGETLFSIAKAAYGDGKKWKQIVAANPGVSPSKLKVGQVLVIPV